MQEGEAVLAASLRLRGEVACAALAGGWLAAGAGRTLCVWRAGEAPAAWSEVAVQPRAHRYALTAARWAAGGALLASGGVDGAVRLWSRALAERGVLAAPGAAAVRALCWAGARVLAGHDDGCARVWARGELLAVLHAHDGALHALAAPLRGALLLSACTDGVLKLHDMEEVVSAGTGGARVAALCWRDGAHDLGALCADAREDGRAAATGGHDARVLVWACGARGVRVARVLEGHAGAVTCVRWARRVLASASLDGTARLWAAGACVRVLRAHSRYLTAVDADAALRVLVTASNDRSARVWELHAPATSLHAPCTPLQHFALGDLEGISTVEGAEPAGTAGTGDAAGGEGARCVWSAGAGGVRGARGSTASRRTDAGSPPPAVTVESSCTNGWRKKETRWVRRGLRGTAVTRGKRGGRLELRRELAGGGGLPALAADFGADGGVLLTAGLDGQATVWDVESGCVLRSLSSLSSGASGAGGAGGGGVRGARVSPHRPPLLLLATDDGAAPLWALADPDPDPIQVYGGGSLAAAALCCAWGAGGRLLVAGGAGGSCCCAPRPPPPRTRCISTQMLTTWCCEFAATAAALALDDDEGFHLLATGGSDSYIKLWAIQYTEGDTTACVRLARRVWAHGGGVAALRLAAGGARLASAGADGWARVWAVASGRCLAALPAPGDAPLTALALTDQYLVLGGLDGGLAVWRLGAEAGAGGSAGGEGSASGGEDEPPHDDPAPRAWRPPAVARWLQEYITRAPDFYVKPETEAEILRLAMKAGLTGARLLDDPITDVIKALGFGDEDASDGDSIESTMDIEERERIEKRLHDELSWLRRPYATSEMEAAAPHWLLCPLTHRVLREPARAADGYSYERANILEWFYAEGGAVSPLSGRRLHSARVAPNYRLREQLRAFELQHKHLYEPVLDYLDDGDF
ncbi:unnamed protein product [Plutella xylostella]|uniref:(diamondback moth) hypothetical protein n=1 Tax=Plutella xylostella TaxID=51655 RepID=A0A8S4G8A4_PLUXY|nr:unnamed protein product [Plutella xylostella]